MKVKPGIYHLSKAVNKSSQAREARRPNQLNQRLGWKKRSTLTRRESTGRRVKGSPATELSWPEVFPFHFIICNWNLLGQVFTYGHGLRMEPHKPLNLSKWHWPATVVVSARRRDR